MLSAKVMWLCKQAVRLQKAYCCQHESLLCWDDPYGTHLEGETRGAARQRSPPSRDLLPEAAVLEHSHPPRRAEGLACRQLPPIPAGWQPLSQCFLTDPAPAHLKATYGQSGHYLCCGWPAAPATLFVCSWMDCRTHGPQDTQTAGHTDSRTHGQQAAGEQQCPVPGHSQAAIAAGETLRAAERGRLVFVLSPPVHRRYSMWVLWRDELGTLVNTPIMPTQNAEQSLPVPGTALMLFLNYFLLSKYVVCFKYCIQ